MTLAMDNFRVNVTAWRGHLTFDLLELVMRVAFADHCGSPRPGVNLGANCYRVIPHTVVEGRIKTVPRLIFGWHQSMPHCTPLPFVMDPVGATDFARRWLEVAEYGPQPDHDGDNSKGWRVANDRCSADYSICWVEPAWAMHGK